MPHYNLAFLGLGNVGRALAQLLESKRAEFRGCRQTGRANGHRQDKARCGPRDGRVS